MAYILIIAEKPSVASSIAKVVGAGTPHREKANGYHEGNGYRVTWAFGHLVGLDSPEQMGYTSGELPMLPETWKTHILCGGTPSSRELDTIVSRQMKLLEGLFEGASRIVVATDAGREGELIFRYIYEYLGCRTPFDRLWISSLTDEAIRKGMASLEDGHRYDALSEAAHARSEADWILGFNASRALKQATGFRGVLSLGRVQTPVLKMICDRFEANRNFVPTPFWQIGASVHKDMTDFDVLSEKHYASEADAKADAGKVSASKRMKVTKVEKKQIATKPPLLFDLTALQRAANTRYGLTAEQTLKAAQSLYEKKYMSYPRTGSRYIPEDVFKTIPALIGKVGGYDFFARAAGELRGKKLCRKSVDDTKVTDHHALLPTENIPAGLSGDEKHIWELVAGRLLEAFGEDSLSDRTSVAMDCAGVLFKASGSVLVKAGWKGVFGAEAASDEKPRKEGEEDAPDGPLPELREGETLPAGKVEVLRKTDKPLPVYTDASLLGDMETCGKKIEDEELREAMKDVGLGTPATRAAVIETLIKRNYVTRNAKKLVPTELGLQIWKIVRDRKIADVATTGEWERDLGLIEKGELRKDRFDKGIRDYTLEVIEDLRRNCGQLDGVSPTGEPVHECPCCGRRMKNMKFSISCPADEGGCGFRLSREVAGKKLPQQAVSDILTKGRSTLIKGFISKAGKKFDARLAVNKEKKSVDFVFDERPAAADTKGLTCPCCGQPLEDTGWKLGCGCGFTLNKSHGGVALSADQLAALCQGKGVPLKGMKSKAGKTYSATLRVNREEKKIEYHFDKK